MTRSPVGVNARLFHYGMGERGTRGGRARYETVWESPGFRDQVTEELRATGKYWAQHQRFPSHTYARGRLGCIPIPRARYGSRL